MGIKVNRITIEDSVKWIEKLISHPERHQICVPNVWTTVLAQKDLDFRKIYNSSSLAIPDGMPLVWVSKMYGKPIHKRISGTDLFFRFADCAAEKGYTFFFLGSTEDTLGRINETVKNKFPSLKILGFYSPPFLQEFPKEVNERMIEIINDAKPDVLWVGMTAPKQEKWIYENLERLDVHVAIGIGAAFEYVAGKLKRAPEWMQNTGLEWLYRVGQEPRRLWKRYLVGNTMFVWLVMKEFVKMKVFKKPLDS